MIGLTGAQGTGKTTLAKAFAELVEIPFIQTSTSQVFKDLGFDPAVDYPIDTRLSIQEAILKSLTAQYETAKGKVFVTDRTPIDMIAYTLADVQRKKLTPEQDARLMLYVKDCVAVTNRIFTLLVVVQPGIKVPEAREGKAPNTEAYVTHVAKLIVGIVAGSDVQCRNFRIPDKTLDLDKRLECLRQAVKVTIEGHKMMVNSAREAGSPIVLH